MQSKSLLIAIAAFAVTATGVQAYGGVKIMGRAGLSQEQAKAFEQARELRQAGDVVGARNTLVRAGITEEHLRSMHRVATEARSAIREAVEQKDYEAFRLAAADSPLADIITSEADFTQFCLAHELRLSGAWAEAEGVMDELGFTDEAEASRRPTVAPVIPEFTDEQREALRVARQANDRSTIQAIFDEVGVSQYDRHRGW